MTMETSFPQWPTAIDEQTRGDHWYLRRADVCRYLGAYAPGKGRDYSATNRLILDFKMAGPRGGRVDLPVKEKAIAGVAAALRRAVDVSVLERAVFVPVPPSKTKDYDGYDVRLVRILRAVRQERPLEVRELIVQARSVEPSYRRAARLQPWEIQELYRIDEAGLFMARRVPEKPAVEGGTAPAEGDGRAEREDGGLEGPMAAAEVRGGASGSRRADRGAGVDARRGGSGSGRRAEEHQDGPGVTEGDGALKIVSVINYKGGSGRRR